MKAKDKISIFIGLFARRTAAAGTRDYPLRCDGMKANLDNRDLEVECGADDFAIVYRDLRQHFELTAQESAPPPSDGKPACSSWRMVTGFYGRFRLRQPRFTLCLLPKQHRTYYPFRRIRCTCAYPLALFLPLSGFTGRGKRCAR